MANLAPALSQSRCRQPTAETGTDAAGGPYLLQGFLEQALSLLEIPLVDVAHSRAVQQVRGLKELFRQLLVDVVGILNLRTTLQKLNEKLQDKSCTIATFGAEVEGLSETCRPLVKGPSRAF